MQNENRPKLMSNISSISFNDETQIEIMKGAGRTEILNLSKWKIQCETNFNRYYKAVTIITMPFDMNNVMKTLSEVCNCEGSRGFICKNYDMVHHLEFLGCEKSFLEEKFKSKLTSSNTSYFVYIEKKKLILLCCMDKCMDNVTTSVKCFLALYSKEIQST